MAYQADIINFPGKKAEYIAQGVQSLAQGIASGIMGYAEGVAKNKEAKRERDQELLKIQNNIDDNYDTLLYTASEKLYEKGGDVEAFRANAKDLAQKAKEAQFELSTNLNLSAEDKELYANAKDQFFAYTTSSTAYASNEAAQKKADQDTYKELRLVEDYTFDPTLINGGKTAKDRAQSQKVGAILDAIRNGKTAPDGYTVSKNNENKNGVSVTTVTIKDDTTGEEFSFPQTVNNVRSYRVMNNNLNAAKSFEEIGVRPKNGVGFTDDYKLGATLTEQEIAVKGYKGILSEGVIDTFAIDTALQSEIKGEIASIVQSSKGELINYMENLGVSDGQIDKFLDPNTDPQELSETLFQMELAQQKDEYKKSLKRRVATQQDIDMFKTYGRQMETDADGNFVVYTETGDLKAVAKPEPKINQKQADDFVIINALNNSMNENISVLSGNNVDAKLTFWNNWLQGKGITKRYELDDDDNVVFVDAKTGTILDENINIDDYNIIAGNVLAEKGVNEANINRYASAQELP